MILSRARIDLYPIIGFGRRAHKTAQTTCQEVLRWVIPHILWYYWTNNVGYVRHGIGMVVLPTWDITYSTVLCRMVASTGRAAVRVQPMFVGLRPEDFLGRCLAT